MTHHVVQHAAALEFTAPEPWCVWTTMFFSRACQIWTASQCCGTRPHDLFASRNRWRKDLILQVAMQQPRALDHLIHLSGFPNIAGQRLLTSNADQLAFAGIERVTDGLHILKTLVVWTTEPHTIDLWSGNHVFD